MALYSWFTRNKKLNQQDKTLTQADMDNENVNKSMWPTASINNFARVRFQAQAQLAFKNRKAESQSTDLQTKTEDTKT